MSASLGGTVATNASGARTFRYGPTRDWVRGIRAMLANGESMDLPRGKYFASPSDEFTITGTAGNDNQVKIPTYTSIPFAISAASARNHALSGRSRPAMI